MRYVCVANRSNPGASRSGNSTLCERLAPSMNRPIGSSGNAIADSDR